jgi:hypothetical protein
MQSRKGNAKAYSIRQALKPSRAFTLSRRGYPITIFYSEEDGGYIAAAPDLKGCSAFGFPWIVWGIS